MRRLSCVRLTHPYLGIPPDRDLSQWLLTWLSLLQKRLKAGQFRSVSHLSADPLRQRLSSAGLILPVAHLAKSLLRNPARSPRTSYSDIDPSSSSDSEQLRKK